MEFEILIVSSILSKEFIVSIGPKISSIKRLLLCGRSLNIIGFKNYHIKIYITINYIFFIFCFLFNIFFIFSFAVSRDGSINIFKIFKSVQFHN